jgi:5-formyltetrahydrofolate cyclo-ligase
VAGELISKDELRRIALARRAVLPGKDALSSQIMETLIGLSEFAAAGTVMIYLDARSEVRTRPALPRLVRGGSSCRGVTATICGCSSCAT